MAKAEQGEPSAHEPKQCPYDCGDNSCVCAGPKRGGMRTNGGCRCTERELRHAVQWWKRLALAKAEGREASHG